MFGTTVEPALKGLLNIRSKINAKYPNTTVRIAFTSNIIRKRWQHRAEDPEYIKAHPEIPADVLHVKTPLATIADLQNEGYDTLKMYGVKKVILKPFMVVAGDHSINDMASDEDDSWKSILEKNGFEVMAVTKGLGEQDNFANIFVNHAAEAAKDAGINIK